MKKLFALMLACLMVLSLGACKKTGETPNDTTGSGSQSSQIEWETLADDDIVGAWEPVNSVAGEYVLFTPEAKLRVVYGTVVFDASIQYGKDGNGNKSAYTDGSYLYGQWTYTINDGVLTITYPKTTDDGEEVFEEQVFNSIDYTPITLLAKEEFKADDALVGNWTNAEYGDSYSFTEDGFAVFSQNIDDGINSYKTEIKHAYTVEDGKINLYYYKSNDNKEVVDTFEYSIDGTMLIIGESDYYLNGQGDPGTTEATAATE